MIIQHEIFLTTRIIKIIINSMAQIYQEIETNTNTNIPQQINFTGKLEQNDGGAMFALLKINKKLF